MIACVPRIYPDELFYSYIARSYVYNAYIRYRDFANDWLAHPKQRISVDFFNPLSLQAKSLLLRHDDEFGILHHHTMFDYYFSFCDHEERKKAENDILLDSALQTALSSMSVSKYAFRYCPVCVKKDRAGYGEAYWHIEHQEPKMICCPEHGVFLHNAEPIDIGILRSELIPAERLLPEVIPNAVMVFPEQHEVCRFAVKTIKDSANKPLDSEKLRKMFPCNLSELADLYNELSKFYSRQRQFLLPSMSEFFDIFQGRSFCAFDVCLLLFAQQQRNKIYGKVLQ